MESVKEEASVRKTKKKKVMDENNRIEQAKKKKKRLELALARSAAIRSELLKKKHIKNEEQERLDEEEWFSFAGHHDAQVAQKKIEQERLNEEERASFARHLVAQVAQKKKEQERLDEEQALLAGHLAAQAVQEKKEQERLNEEERASFARHLVAQVVQKKEQERLEEEWASFSGHLAAQVASGKHLGDEKRTWQRKSMEERGMVVNGIEHVAEELGVGRSTIKRNPSLFEAAGTTMQPVSEVVPESETVMVKARYEDEIIKFKLCLSSTMYKLEKEVGRRLDLEKGSFKLRYLDEDHDYILLACDDDLQLCLTSLTAGDNNTMLLFVQLIPK